MTLALLLDPSRAARLLAAPSTDPGQLGLGELLDEVWRATWKAPAVAPGLAGVRRTVDEVALAAVLRLVSSTTTLPGVRALAFGKLHDFREWASAQAAHAKSAEDRAHLPFAAAQIHTLDVLPGETPEAVGADRIPRGQPIGTRAGGGGGRDGRDGEEGEEGEE